MKSGFCTTVCCEAGRICTSFEHMDPGAQSLLCLCDVAALGVDGSMNALTLFVYHVFYVCLIVTTTSDTRTIIVTTGQQ
jgi:hypothetical protein